MQKKLFFSLFLCKMGGMVDNNERVKNNKGHHNNWKTSKMRLCTLSRKKTDILVL